MIKDYWMQKDRFLSFDLKQLHVRFVTSFNKDMMKMMIYQILLILILFFVCLTRSDFLCDLCDQSRCLVVFEDTFVRLFQHVRVTHNVNVLFRWPRLSEFGGLFCAANASAYCTLCATCMAPINHHLILCSSLVRLWCFLNSGSIWFCLVQSSTARVS